MKRYNKASIAAVLGAVSTVFAIVFPDLLDTKQLAALQGALTTILVYAIPNVDT